MTDRYAQLRSFYAEFATHDDDSRKVAWRCFDDQILRLEALLEGIDSDDFPVSILDVGCGTGELYGLLERTGRLGDYLGVDLLPSMVERARQRFPEGRFIVTDLLTWKDTSPFDVVICSGTLNVKVQAHEQWLQRMLRAMWKRTGRALLVNFQWARAYDSNPVNVYDADIFHAQRDLLLKLCEKLTPWLTMRQDYLGEDIAFYLYRDYHKTADRLVREPSYEVRGDAEHACGLAFLYLERKLPAAALAVLDGVEPTALVYNYLGLAHHNLGNLKKARKYYRLAIGLDPMLQEARLNLDWIVNKE